MKGRRPYEPPKPIELPVDYIHALGASHDRLTQDSAETATGRPRGIGPGGTIGPMIKKSGKDYRRVTFRGYSMYPFLRPGDVLVLAAVEPQFVKPGDIVCLDIGRTYVAHRVVDISRPPRARILILKGDNLPYTDRPFPPGSGPLLKVAMIIRGKGRLVRPRFGKLIALLSRNNLTPGIIRGRIGRVVRGVYGRFLTLFSRTPGPIG